MKKIRILTLLTFFLTVGLCSCSSDDEKKDETLATQILGTWSLKMPQSQQTTRDELPNEFRVQFNSDLKGAFTLVYVVDNNDELYSSDLTYKVVANDVNFSFKEERPDGSLDEQQVVLRVASINATTMTAKILDEKGEAKFPGTDKNIDYVFTKVTK